MLKPTLRLETLNDRALPSTASLVGNVLTITGTSGNDIIVVHEHQSLITIQGTSIDVAGLAKASVLEEQVHHIVVNGLGGNDIIKLTGVSIPSTLNGGLGADIITGSLKDDSISGNDGNDIINGSDGKDTIHGGNGIDNINGGGNDDSITGDAGNDVLSGGLGDDSISGGDGRDFENGGGGNDDLNGDAGDDRLLGGIGDDSLQGGVGNDKEDGGSGNDHVNGGLGDDVVDGGAGSDDVNGDSGNDINRHGERKGNASDFRAALTSVAGAASGEAEAQTISGFTEFQIEVKHAASNRTFDVKIDVAGDGSNVVTIGQLTTDSTGEGVLEVHKFAGLSALNDGKSRVTVTPTTADSNLNISGTLANTANSRGKFEAALKSPSNPNGSLLGSAEYKTVGDKFETSIFGASPNTTLNVYVTVDSTNVLVGTIKTDSKGRGKLELAPLNHDPLHPLAVIKNNTPVVVTDVTGNTVILKGTLSVHADDN